MMFLECLDVVVVAGGRSRRLGLVPKSDLRIEGRTLLERTVEAAARHARRLVVLGERGVSDLPPAVLVTREDPPFEGPAAAMVRGAAMLAASDDPSEFTMVLACDMPRIGEALPVLVRAVSGAEDGVIAVDSEGRRQPLAAIYRTEALLEAARGRELGGSSVRALVAGLDLRDVAVPPGSTRDVDTWTDADELGVERP